VRTIIAGSRSITDFHQVRVAIEFSGIKITEVISGCARGVDTLGEQWAITADVPIKRFPADWGKLGKSAGYLRNQQMADYADALIAVHDGVSRGTADMIRRAKKRGLVVYVSTPEPEIFPAPLL